MKLYRAIYEHLELIHQKLATDTLTTEVRDLRKFEEIIRSELPSDLTNNIKKLEIFLDDCIVEPQIDNKLFKYTRICVYVMYVYKNRFSEYKYHHFTFMVVPSFKTEILINATRGRKVKARPIKENLVEELTKALLKEID